MCLVDNVVYYYRALGSALCVTNRVTAEYVLKCIVHVASSHRTKERQVQLLVGGAAGNVGSLHPAPDQVPRLSSHQGALSDAAVSRLDHENATPIPGKPYE